jgi:hypothetical protein
MHSKVLQRVSTEAKLKNDFVANKMVEVKQMKAKEE